MTLFKFGRLKIICQTAKLSTLKIILRMWYVALTTYVLSTGTYIIDQYNFRELNQLLLYPRPLLLSILGYFIYQYSTTDLILTKE